MRLVAADGWSVVGEMGLWRVVSSVARAKRDTHIIEYQQDNQSSCISGKAGQNTQRFINQGVADHRVIVNTSLESISQQYSEVQYSNCGAKETSDKKKFTTKLSYICYRLKYLGIL